MKQFKRLEEYAKYNRILFTQQEQERFQKFCELLLEKNKVLNLTAIEDLDEIEVKHFIDSVSAAPLICSLIMGVDLHNLKIKPTDYHLYSSQNSDTHGLRAQEMGLQLAPPLEAKNVGFVGMSINAATPQPVKLIDIGTGAGFPDRKSVV